MKTSYHRSGKQSAGKHTTLTAPAKKIFDLCMRIPTVDRCAPGFIVRKNSIKHHAIKVVMQQTYVQIKVSGESAVQILNVYSTKEDGAQQKTYDTIVSLAKSEGIIVRLQ